MFNSIKVLSKEESLSLSNDDILKLGVKLLKDKEFATIALYDEIKKSIEQFGPYFVFDNGISVAHAPQGDHSLKIGSSLMVSKAPIDFFGKQVNIFITLAVPKDGDHMALLQKVISLLKDEKEKDKILQYTKEDEI